MDQALNQKIDAFIAANKEQILEDIAALDKTLELAAGMGLATRNCENYIGYAELAGADPEKYLATICHVDVVPVGNGWARNPSRCRSGTAG